MPWSPQEIFAIDLSMSLKPSKEHDHKHVLRLLRLYGDQALVPLSCSRRLLRYMRNSSNECTHDSHIFFLSTLPGLEKLFGEMINNSAPLSLSCAERMFMSCGQFQKTLNLNQRRHGPQFSF